MKVNPGLRWGTQDVRDARVMGLSAKKSCMQDVKTAQERSVVRAVKAGRIEPFKSFDIRYEAIGFGSLPNFSIALGQYFLTVPLLLFEMVIHILCHCILEAYNCFLILQGVTVKRLP